MPDRLTDGVWTGPEVTAPRISSSSEGLNGEVKIEVKGTSGSRIKPETHIRAKDSRLWKEK